MFKILTICAFWYPKPQDNHQGWMAGRSEKKSIERSNESSVSTLQSTEKWSNQTITLQKSSPKRVTCFLTIICSPTRLLDPNCVCKLPYTSAPLSSCKPCDHDYRGSGDSCGRLWFNRTMLLQEGGHSTFVGGVNSWQFNPWLFILWEMGAP